MQVVERVFLVGRGGWGGLEPLSAQGDCNVYLIDGGFELALVDVGVGPDCDQVRRNVVAAGFDPRRITKVLLTHTHWDHAGALPGLRRFARRALVCAHPAAAEAVREGHPYLGAGPAAKRLGAARARRIFHIDHTVREGDLIRVGEATLRVLELPGHTPDSVGWLLTAGGKKVLFSGDAGRFGLPILRDPAEPLPECDYLITECTYADRRHENPIDMKDRLCLLYTSPSPRD